ncbi:MAG: hypothetical protein A2122_01515 [Candidatus Liptonbacteria bacterium GWB1_49_6]|uniref:Uncharacterized protein n=1 Tax=Candidatus Liptonbacteria bacterium GWB1_49_6 TaxID=1798644 RepID=A0A1G2C6P0_9BACT|nr:MAG: hypothetical protein A2122_01515 [Candidatus Liptonbacteria bacterium GWB1_49_6]
MKNKKIFLRIVVVFILIFLGYFLLRSQKGGPKIDSASPTSEELSADSAKWNIPPLFPDVAWRTPSQEESHRDYFTIYIGNGTSLEELNGTEWIFKQNTQEGDKTFSQDFEIYYRKEASEKGWGFEIPFKNNTLQAPSADGPMGSLWGYLKRKDNLVRLIGLESHWNYTYSSPEEGGVCPCSEELRVFLSDPLPIDKIPFSQ